MMRERTRYPHVSMAAALVARDHSELFRKLAGTFDAAFDAFQAARAQEEARQAQRDFERFPALHATQPEMMLRSTPTFTPIGQRREY